MNRLWKHPDRDIVIDYDNGNQVYQLWAHFEHVGRQADIYSYHAHGMLLTFALPADSESRHTRVGLEILGLTMPWSSQEFEEYQLRKGVEQITPWTDRQAVLSVGQISSLWGDGIPVKLSKALSGEGGFNWKMALVIGGIAVIGFLGYRYISSHSKKAATDNTTTQQTTTKATSYELNGYQLREAC